MFGNMMGDLEAQQNELKQKLNDVEVSKSIENGKLKVTANANRVIQAIDIDPSLMEDKEQLEDLLVVLINEVLEQAGAQEAMATQELVQKMMPPGMGGLGSLFK